MINAKDWKAKGHYWTWKNHQIFTVEKGEGPVLLLIHGFPTSSWDWAKIWPELTKKFRVIAHDMMGFGWTDKPKDFPYSIHAQADMLEDYLKVHNIESVHILAHDYGDTVAQEMWSRHLEGKAGFPDIQSVVLLNGGIFPETHHAILLQKLLLSPIGKWVNRLTNQKRFDKNFSSV
ncbi:MAG: alpha/beta fold hydrolase, partial [Bacteroidota bacterium]